MKEYPKGLVWATQSDSVNERLPVKEMTYPQGSLLVVGGQYGIGKSTLANKIRASSRCIVLDPDVIAKKLELTWDTDEATRLIYGEHFHQLHRALSEGQTVISAAPALLSWQRRAFAKYSKKAGRPLHYIYLDGSAQLALDGQKKRGSLISRDSNQRCQTDWQTLRKVIEDGASLDDVNQFRFTGHFKNAQSVALLDRVSANDISISFG